MCGNKKLWNMTGPVVSDKILGMAGNCASVAWPITDLSASLRGPFRDLRTVPEHQSQKLLLVHPDPETPSLLSKFQDQCKAQYCTYPLTNKTRWYVLSPYPSSYNIILYYSTIRFYNCEHSWHRLTLSSQKTSSERRVKGVKRDGEPVHAKGTSKRHRGFDASRTRSVIGRSWFCNLTKFLLTCKALSPS